jgi:hypothetical protein
LIPWVIQYTSGLGSTSSLSHLITVFPVSFKETIIGEIFSLGSSKTKMKKNIDSAYYHELHISFLSLPDISKLFV